MFYFFPNFFDTYLVKISRLDRIIMDAQFNIHEIIAKGFIESELELERAIIADRKLKHLTEKHPEYNEIRKDLRNLIASYETKNWDKDSEINSSKIDESDHAATIAEKEQQFLNKRKDLIRKKLKAFNLTQQELGLILGHKNKSYISELMNGVSPFSLRDLIVIHRLLKIRLSDLIPTFLPQKDRIEINASIAKLNNENLKFSKDDLERV